ncbi:hypothetical protein BY996DRAFT_8551141 [Phakopsora pachyrhizi]|uniref:Uncharacterized protein n=1 Tax=Phakopsora pachyrhizi TaxID=170000 RepID=A0AAV0BW03_PHAPC|nr:hypothetical protein BY996DRAFT_8551141 [Phakopsora pachyrhizi]CAH7690415.1 hypothetical protein PPACK8108_LOCUS25761 [Phakopsora pachyrhizi]
MTSAPETIREVSEHPPANAVTVPTDKELKSKDEERKMRLYGVIEAFRAGKYPSNAQIDKTLAYAIDHSPIEEERLSPDGKQLIQDFRDIIETSRVMVQKKNSDELMQNFLFHTRHIDSENHLKSIKDASNSAPNKEEAKSDGQAATQHLRTLAKLIYTSSETRKLLKDISLLARDVMADAAVKVAETTRPDGEALRQVDEAAPSAEWVGPDGEKHGAGEHVPSTGIEENVEQANENMDKARGQANKVYEKVDDATSAVKSHADEAASKVTSTATESQQADTTKAEAKRVSSNKAEQASSTAEEHINRLKAAYGNVIGKIPKEHKEKARNLRDSTKDYMHDKFPRERRDRFIYRLKKVIVEQQRHRDYQEAVDFFLSIAETYQGHANSVTTSAKSRGSDVLQDPQFQEAQREMRTLLERFANGSSMQPIFDAINQIYSDAQNDPELKEWFKSLDNYVRKVLQEPGYVMKDSCDKAGREINESGKRFWSHKYASHRQNLFDEIEKFFVSYAEDPLNIRFGKNWKNLTKNLFLNSEGSLTLKTHLWEDITSVILPSLLKHIGYIPIPRIEYTDEHLDLVIENLTLEGQNLLPNVVELEIRNYFKLSAYEKISNANKHSFWISFNQVQADLRDVAFYVHKKSGFPKIKDSGLADVVISGDGVSGKVHIESSEARDRVFAVKDVKIKVNKLSFGIRDTKHNFLYSTLKPLAQSLVKKQIAKAIEDGIRSSLAQLDAQLVDIKERLETADGDDKVSKMDIIKETFINKKEDASVQLSEEKDRKGTFKLVAKRESKIIDWTSRNSLIEKQGEKQETLSDNSIAGGWKTDVFTMYV